MMASRFINASTAPILTACVLSGAALAFADALTSPAAAAPALIVQFTSATTGASMAHSKQEGRRPGITKIFDEIKKQHPKKTNGEIATLAKVEWTKRFGPGTEFAKNAPAGAFRSAGKS